MSQMQAEQDIAAASSSLGARRPAASNLPMLTGLPPPPMASLHDKYQAMNSGSSVSQSSMPSQSLSSAGSLLTPPNTLPGELSPPSNVLPASSGPTLPSFSTQPLQSGSLWANGLPAVPQFNSYNPAPSPSQWIPPRGMYSPNSFSIDSLMSQQRNMALGSGGMGTSSYDMQPLPPFATNFPMADPGQLSTLPVQQQMQMMQNFQNHYFNNQAQAPSSSSSTQVSPALAQEAFAARAPPTPAYYNQHAHSNNDHSPPSLPFSSASASSHSAPISPPDGSNRISPTSGNDLSRTTSAQLPTSQSPHPFSRPTSFGFPNPNHPNPALSNMHNAPPSLNLVTNGQPHHQAHHQNQSLSQQNNSMSSYASTAGSISNVYGPPHSHSPSLQQPQPQHQTPTDRPFKCDACPQSFNRNHDLKRHKRIHLAVKPFPCGYCDKSFSRKDALKVR